MDYSLNVPSGKTLDIEPGAIINVRGFIWVEGLLRAEGKSTLPIVFTSVSDPSYGVTHTAVSGYDVDRDKNFESIYIMEKGEFRGTNVKIGYGGKNYEEQSTNFPANIKVWGNALIINLEVGEPLTDGVFASGTLNIINTKLYNCAESGISALGQLSLTNSTLTQNKSGLEYSSNIAPKLIISNSFIKNREYGLYNMTKNTIDAQYNYWGLQYGPSYYDKRYTECHCYGRENVKI